MKGRPLHSWPLWKLRLALMFPRWRALWADAWLELWHRSTEDAERIAREACNDESGPWPVSMPRGFH